MTRKPVIMLIDDEPIPEVEMALAQEQHNRTSEFGRLCNEGHVRVLLDCDPNYVRCEIEGEIFSELRENFPSIVLMARLQLAIASGRSCKNQPPERDHAVEDMRQMWQRGNHGRQTDYVWKDEIDWARSEAISQGYSNVAKITKGRKVTATVKARQGGLRP